jgi:preprotein translocase subunit SecA
MELLERSFEVVGNFFNGVLRGFERGVTSMFGSANARQVRRMMADVEKINAMESRFQALSDEELRNQTPLFRKRLIAGETLDDLLPEAFAACREAGRRFLGMRHYDVQLIGGMVLHGRAIAEMVTGEGKTLVATLPAYLNALEGKGVHVVTVNDYLARRDMEWMAPIYMGLGLTVGAIQSDMKVLDRQKAYSCDITYGTNNEFGFDYLRDNMRHAARGDKAYAKYPEQQQSQQALHFAIIDEVDNILIDEARTPLIISGPAHDDVAKYAEADRIARMLKRDEHFQVNEKDHTAHLTEDGVRYAEKLAGVDSFYTPGNMHWPHLIDNSLKAHHLYKLDVNYVINDGQIKIVDEFTGRIMEGRQWSDGLHQAVEAKEGVKIKEETQTMATITLQNFFKLYKKICGMTGTAMTEASEFWKIYKLDVLAIPTNRQMRRLEHPDVIYRTEREKYAAVADEIEQLNKWDCLVLKNGDEVYGEIASEKEDEIVFVQTEGTKRERESFPREKIKRIQKKGRPVLVGTVSIEKSERLSRLLDQRGIKHQVLNAKQHRREAEIVAQAGRLGGVTIATNMAGRGTDIILGGNPETMAWAQLQDKYPTRLEVPHDEWTSLVQEIEQREKMKEQGAQVKELGGLHVIGTERHESRRIDLQLRGRTGRQGDPGSSRFFLSLEDDLMRIFAGPWVKSILDRLGMQEGEKIESRMVTGRIEAAQKKVEERHFEQRKSLLDYDEVMDEQRKRLYGYRQKILDGYSCRELILDMVEDQIDHYVDLLMHRDYAVETFATFAGGKLGCQFEARDFRGMDYEQAETFAHGEATRMVETQIFDAIDENLPEGDEEEWNWDALTKFASSRCATNYKPNDLKRVGRDEVSEMLIGTAHKAIEKLDLSEGRPILEPDFALRSLLNWAEVKFSIDLKLEDVRGLEPKALKQLLSDKAREAYELKEAEYPVKAAMSSLGGMIGIDGNALVEWARRRFETDLSIEDIRNKRGDEITQVLVEKSKASQAKADQMIVAVKEKVATLFGGTDGEENVSLAKATGGNGALNSFSDWLHDELKYDIDVHQLAELDRNQLERKLQGAVDDLCRPEMRRMEREVLLEIVDSAWKEHLLVMDRLRSSIGLMGYAQVDPKVEYKREGMKLFDQMWKAIGERATDLVYRMEQLNEDFVSHTWRETTARKDDAQSVSQMSRDQQEAIDMSQGEGKVDPIRNRGQKVGRNDPCPCGSGKKFKNCHMREQGNS